MAESYIGSKLCYPGDLVINTMWAWMGALGVSKYQGIVSPSYGVYCINRKDLIDDAYLGSLLRTTPYITKYNQVSTGLHSSRLRLYPHLFLNIEVLLPPLDEQKAIVAHLEAYEEQHRAVVDATKRESELLKEYKQTLIASAVTGQIRV